MIYFRIFLVNFISLVFFVSAVFAQNVNFDKRLLDFIDEFKQETYLNNLKNVSNSNNYLSSFLINIVMHDFCKKTLTRSCSKLVFFKHKNEYSISILTTNSKNLEHSKKVKSEQINIIKNNGMAQFAGKIVHFIETVDFSKADIKIIIEMNTLNSKKRQWGAPFCEIKLNIDDGVLLGADINLSYDELYIYNVRRCSDYISGKLLNVPVGVGFFNTFEDKKNLFYNSIAKLFVYWLKFKNNHEYPEDLKQLRMLIKKFEVEVITSINERK